MAPSAVDKLLDVVNVNKLLYVAAIIIIIIIIIIITRNAWQRLACIAVTPSSE